jgi:hypothetical protein
MPSEIIDLASRRRRIAEIAPGQWRIADHTTDRYGGGGYLSIVDATGNRVCDFFPFANQGGRGKEATLVLARQIIEWERDDDKAS